MGLPQRRCSTHVVGGGPPRQQKVPGAVEIYVVHVLPVHRCAGIGGKLWDLACTTLRGPALAPLYLETLAELPCCAFYDARGGEVLTRAAGAFYGGAVTHLTYYWPAGKPHQTSSQRAANRQAGALTGGS